jgi:translation initiation factor 2 subunit 2
MDEYKNLLERARKSLPPITKAAERFETPVAEIVTGKQTVIRNFTEIAKVLRRDTRHLAKFLFKELAIPGSIRNSELVLQGKVYSSLINQRIAEYVERFVLCHECRKPDTKLQEDKITTIKCEACGARRTTKSI